MAKLEKREIILIVIAALFVLYAGYEYLIAGPASKKVKTSASAEAVNIDASIAGIAKDLDKDKITDFLSGKKIRIESGRPEKGPPVVVHRLKYFIPVM